MVHPGNRHKGRRRRTGLARHAANPRYSPFVSVGEPFNNSDRALDVNSDAVAYATLQYAMNTSDINGVRGKGDFQPPAEPGPVTQ